MKQKRRSFEGIRIEILKALQGGRNTVNEISHRTEINWKTVDNHLVYLCGRGWTAKVFDSPTIKIFELTKEGQERIERHDLRMSMAQARTEEIRGQKTRAMARAKS